MTYDPSRLCATASAVLITMAFAGCQHGREGTSTSAARHEAVDQITKIQAVAQLGPSSGSRVHGTVYFFRQADGVRLTGEISGLSPGLHGFHVHEKGDCSAADATSAGGHFNPTGQPHGAPDMEGKHHTGDFGNISADGAGIAHVSMIFRGVSLEGDNSVIGRALVVHEKADDMTTQPAGNSGPRVACGVIEKSNK